MDAAWDGPRPVPVHAMPEMVSMNDVVDANILLSDGHRPLIVPLGLEFEDLHIVQANLQESGGLLIVGSVQSGKTIALQTLLLLMTHIYRPDELRLYIFDAGFEDLRALAEHPRVALFVESYTCSEEAAPEAIEALKAVLEERRQRYYRVGGSTPLPRIVIVVENAFGVEDGIATMPDKDELGDIVAGGRRFGFHLVVSASAKKLSSRAFNGVVTDFQSYLILGSIEESEFSLGLELPPVIKRQYRHLPPGDALVYRRGRYQHVRLATWLLPRRTHRRGHRELGSV
ncbi:MAG: FtsK/SpoIIIE domain-containing protein [Ardenticatenia bacterium]|nr:FtsK/SpoIIIE domain-containing protein [Ardenticatenia bacterium]